MEREPLPPASVDTSETPGKKTIDTIQVALLSAIAACLIGPKLYMDRADYNDRLSKFGTPARQAWDAACRTPSNAADCIDEMDEALLNGYLQRSSIGVTDEDVQEIMRMYYLRQAKGYWHAAIGSTDEPQPDYSDLIACRMLDEKLAPLQKFEIGQATMLHYLVKAHGRLESISLTQTDIHEGYQDALRREAEFHLQKNEPDDPDSAKRP